MGTAGRTRGLPPRHSHLVRDAQACGQNSNGHWRIRAGTLSFSTSKVYRVLVYWPLHESVGQISSTLNLLSFFGSAGVFFLLLPRFCLKREWNNVPPLGRFKQGSSLKKEDTRTMIQTQSDTEKKNGTVQGARSRHFSRCMIGPPFLVFFWTNVVLKSNFKSDLSASGPKLQRSHITRFHLSRAPSQQYSWSDLVEK